MQISRHWRLNSLRYRLQGVRYENGKVSMQSRPSFNTESDEINKAQFEYRTKRATIGAA